MKLTYIGGPTALLELKGLRLITDPTFDPRFRGLDGAVALAQGRLTDRVLTA